MQRTTQASERYTALYRSPFLRLRQVLLVNVRQNRAYVTVVNQLLDTFASLIMALTRKHRIASYVILPKSYSTRLHQAQNTRFGGSVVGLKFSADQC